MTGGSYILIARSCQIMNILIIISFTAAKPVNVGGKLLTADGVDSEDREKLHKN